MELSGGPPIQGILPIFTYRDYGKYGNLEKISEQSMQREAENLTELKWKESPLGASRLTARNINTEKTHITKTVAQTVDRKKLLWGRSCSDAVLDLSIYANDEQQVCVQAAHKDTIIRRQHSFSSIMALKAYLLLLADNFVYFNNNLW